MHRRAFVHSSFTVITESADDRRVVFPRVTFLIRFSLVETGKKAISPSSHAAGRSSVHSFATAMAASNAFCIAAIRFEFTF